jgi:hypothetical protein
MARNSTSNSDETMTPEAEAISGGRNSNLFATPDLRAITSMDEAIALVEQTLGVEMVDAEDEIGNGFTVLRKDQKHLLIGVPFFIMSVDFQEGDYMDEETGTTGNFATLMIITDHGDKYILNDGGTGIYRQIEDWAIASGKVGGMIVKNGLRESKYEAKGERPAGVTYYLNP